VNARGRTERGDDGFTLVEMLVCIVVLGIIFTVLTGALMIGLRSTSNVSVKFDESNAAQLTALYFTRDVQGAQTVTLDDATASCGGAAKLKLTSTTADRVVSYALTGSTTLQLVRRLCSPASTSPVVTTLVPVVTSASNVTFACTNSCRTVTLGVEQPGATGVVPGLSFSLQASSRVS
jgi:prepilin-type N-terminal cleavage/methylation domain-containing protein